MTVTLAVLAVIMGLFVVWLVRQSINVRPWVAQSIPGRAPPLAYGLTAPRVGLVAFIAVATSVFAISISAYSMRMHMGSGWLHLHPPPLLWVNTAVLVLASVAIQWTWSAARRGDARNLSPLADAGNFLRITQVGSRHSCRRYFLCLFLLLFSLFLFFSLVFSLSFLASHGYRCHSHPRRTAH